MHPARDMTEMASNVINIEPESEVPKDGTVLIQSLSTNEPDRDLTMQSVVAQLADTEISGEMSTKQANTQQRISEDYAVPGEIASEALLLLQTMSQPNPQEPEDDDNYTLSVGTERLPDLISEMNQESGIETVVNYDAEIPEEMRLQTKEPTENKDKESDEMIILDASVHPCRKTISRTN